MMSCSGGGGFRQRQRRGSLSFYTVSLSMYTIHMCHIYICVSHVTCVPHVRVCGARHRRAAVSVTDRMVDHETIKYTAR